ncbi:M20/M25/M40 family metallo-hydrolase [Rhodohalobacter sp. 8-1]|uniref:M20/M25/M40 family metallo-hydrolase n=1 Tax=Rhodohalobacter sp. 8-1 TaxID=3131972 RepID=UPI0030EE799E
MTNRVLSSLIIVFAALLITSCSGNPYDINEAQASRLIETLSSDEMRGRRAFTPDIDRAAEFISDEFKEAGLSYFTGLNSYKQDFSIREYTVTERTVSVSGNIIPESRHFGLVNGTDISWEPGSVSTETIGVSDEFTARFNELRSVNINLLVFVDEAHRDIFNRYQSYFSNRNSRVMEGDTGSTVYFALGNPSDEFEVTISADERDMGLSNVIGRIDGNRKDEIVLFSAHYDHLGIQNAVEGDSVANGANDNASGVTAVIELARYFESLGRPERTLLFVGFTAEEMGGYGSQYFSRQLNPDNIVAMFNIEMIGKPAVSGANTAWITGYERSSFGQLLSKSAEGTVYEFYPDPYPDQNLFYRSDNATLARLGVPAHTISTTPIDVDPDYHRVTDEFDTINISHLTNTIKAIAKAAEGIISGEDTPTRVDASQVD